jgi:leucyl aminopeptidase (aminopeptidase T)
MAENRADAERYERCLSRTGQVMGLLDRDSSNGFARFLHDCCNRLISYDSLTRRPLPDPDAGKMDLEELLKLNDRLFGNMREDGYDSWFASPVYAASLFGTERGRRIAFLATELVRSVAMAVRGQRFLLSRLHEGIHSLWQLGGEGAEPSCPDEESLASAIREFQDYDRTKDYTASNREMFDPSFTLYRDILLESDLSDPRYLFDYGCLITESEVGTATFLCGLDSGDIREMAVNFADSFRRGFLSEGKDISSKSTVMLSYFAGFERLARELLTVFEEDLGLAVVVPGVRTTLVNEQLNYDHRFDFALYLDEGILERRIENMKAAAEATSSLAGSCSGWAVLSRFGKKPFEPESRGECTVAEPARAMLFQKLQSEGMSIQNAHMPRSETSFTMASLPYPEIGEQFEPIFRETVAINSLASEDYEPIQSTIIDVLDLAEFVEVKGVEGNDTDLRVALHALEDPGKQTRFVNSLAEQNIPLGEVFTSPRLKGTTGTLHVESAFLRGLDFSDLRLEFVDGEITSYSCANFDDPDRGREYVRENLLFPHDTLPMGEFAIGTNTLAFAMASRRDIMRLLPVLILEKAGPHFAIGDTCFAREEDHPVRNLHDGKEIIARDNERSILRKEDPDSAYTNTHIDITLPYHSIGSISAVVPDGGRTDIIRDGRFVLPGTETLNEPLERLVEDHKRGNDS